MPGWRRRWKKERSKCALGHRNLGAVKATLSFKNEDGSVETFDIKDAEIVDARKRAPDPVCGNIRGTITMTFGAARSE